MKRLMTIVGVAACLLSGAVSAHAEDLNAIYEKAKSEGTVTWYAVHGTEATVNAIAEAFGQRYPGVKLNAVKATAQVNYQRLTQELSAGALQVDLYESTDLGQLLTLKEQGHLESYRPETDSQIIPALQKLDADGQFHVVHTVPLAIAYNTNLVKPEELPKLWKDLGDDSRSGKVAFGHPGFSGNVGVWTVAMNKLYGWEYFERLEKNKPLVGRSIIDAVTALNSGERAYGLVAAPTAFAAAEKGNPIGVVYPDDGAVLTVVGAGIVKGAPHPNAAKLLLNFLQGKETAALMVKDFEYPIRPDVALRDTMKPLTEIKAVQPTAQELVEQLPELVEKFRDTFGI